MTFDKVYLAAIRVCVVCGACGRPQSGSGETCKGKAARRWFARCANSSSRSMMARSCTCRHMCRVTVKDTVDTCGATSYDITTTSSHYLLLILPNTFRLHLTPNPPPLTVYIKSERQCGGRALARSLDARLKDCERVKDSDT